MSDLEDAMKGLEAADAPVSAKLRLQIAAQNARMLEEIEAVIAANYPQPRVITRVMDDGVQTKDGAA